MIRIIWSDVKKFLFHICYNASRHKDDSIHEMHKRTNPQKYSQYFRGAPSFKNPVFVCLKSALGLSTVSALNLFCYLESSFTSLSAASFVSSGEAKVENRK